MKIRPTFELNRDAPPEDIRARMKRLLDQPDRCDASVLKSYALIRIPEQDQHFWSPQLNVEWLESDDGTRIKGRFGPRPSVWTMFAGFYLFSVFLGIMGLIFGLAQRQLDMNAWALWAVPLSLVCLGVSYTVAASGQKLGHDQMEALQELLQRVIDDGDGS